MSPRWIRDGKLPTITNLASNNGTNWEVDVTNPVHDETNRNKRLDESKDEYSLKSDFIRFCTVGLE